MKKILLLLLVVFSITNISFAQLSLSLVAKGNYSFSNMQSANFDSYQESFVNADQFFQEIVPNQIPSNMIELRVRPSFEIGTEASFTLNKRLNFILGLNLQQLRLEAIPENNYFPVDPFPQNTLSYIYYLKIPLLVEFNLYKEKLFLQGGMYAASRIRYHYKELDRKASNPLVFETTVPADSFLEINSGDQLNSFLFGFQTGVKYQFLEKLSVNMNYSYSLNNFFDQNTALDMNLNNFSFGLQWRLI